MNINISFSGDLFENRTKKKKNKIKCEIIGISGEDSGTYHVSQHIHTFQRRIQSGMFNVSIWFVINNKLILTLTVSEYTQCNHHWQPHRCWISILTFSCISQTIIYKLRAETVVFILNMYEKVLNPFSAYLYTFANHVTLFFTLSYLHCWQEKQIYL